MLRLHVKNLENIAVLRLQGQMVNGETEILQKTLDSLSYVSAVVLDLRQVTTVDARGLGVMLELREQAEARGMRLQLMNVSRPIARVLKLARLDTVFQITSSVEFVRATRGHRIPVPALASCA